MIHIDLNTFWSISFIGNHSYSYSMLNSSSEFYPCPKVRLLQVSKNNHVFHLFYRKKLRTKFKQTWLKTQLNWVKSKLVKYFREQHIWIAKINGINIHEIDGYSFWKSIELCNQSDEEWFKLFIEAQQRQMRATCIKPVFLVWNHPTKNICQ